jgi:hypothetical protein
MPCTPSYCDIHDYPVAGPWCAMSWHTSRAPARDVEALRSEIRREIHMALDEMPEEQAPPPRPPSAVRPLPAPKGGGYQWKR